MLKPILQLIAALGLCACVSVKPVDEAIEAHSVNPLKHTCAEPIEFTQDCSNFSGARRLIILDEVRVRVAANDSGDKILLMDGSRWKNAFLENPFLLNNPRTSRASNDGFRVVKEILDANEVPIREIQILRSFGNINGYILYLDANGYQHLLPFTKSDEDDESSSNNALH